MTIEEILAVEDIGKRIQLLKMHRRTPQPKVKELKNAWDPDCHDVMNPNIRKKRRVLVKEAVTDDDGNIIKPAVYQQEDVNRIALPIEQEIVNIHTAFTVGKDPTISYKSNNDNEDKLYAVVQAVNRDNKIRYQNKRLVRTWFSEQEAVEYWYEKDGSGFWSKIAAKLKQLFGNKRPENKLRCAIWSPFRGDKLYPFYDDSGDYVAQSREYQAKEVTLTGVRTVLYFQTVTATNVYLWKCSGGQWEEVADKTFAHHFPKLPCIYIYRDAALCANIKSMRARLEKVLSDYSDCIDYHFFPYLILKGELAGEAGLGNQDERRRTIKLEDEADAFYLTWDQTPESIKNEINTLFENIYGLTDTPRITFENMKGIGQIASGVSFKYMFMSTLLAVDNHAEVIGEFLQRRYNFIVSAIGSLCPALKGAADSIDLSVEITPYTIDSLSEKLDIVTKARDAGLMSRKSGIIFIGMTDQVDEEIDEIEAEQKAQPQVQSQANESRQ